MQSNKILLNTIFGFRGKFIFVISNFMVVYLYQSNDRHVPK